MNSATVDLTFQKTVIRSLFGPKKCVGINLEFIYGKKWFYKSATVPRDKLGCNTEMKMIWYKDIL